MSEFFTVPAELLCHVFTSFADRLAEHFEVKPTETDDSSRPELKDDFVLHDSKDTIFEEFENSQNATDPFAWKRNMPSMKVSLMNSAYFAFTVTVIAGGLLGVASLLLMYLLISTVYTCEWKPLTDPTYLLKMKRRRIIGQSYQAFILYFWQAALMCMVFKWSFLKDVNLFTCALIGASIDLGYRFFLSVYDMYYPPWVPYPLNVVYTAVILTTSFSIGRKIFKTNRFRAIVLAFKLGSQFITGAISSYIVWYGLFPWFVHQEDFYLKVVILAITYLILVLPKMISRQCVLRLNGVNHPGTSYVLVSTVCGCANIVYRLMQAEFKSLLAFTALSIGFGAIHLAYDLMIILRDRYSERLRIILYSKLGLDSSRHSVGANMSTPRAQRLAADLAIQEMMSSSTAVVLSVGIIFVYGFIHQITSIEKYQQMIVELVTRVVLGLFIEFIFITVSVMLLTRTRNIPVLRVWDCKWKSHLTVCLITVIMILMYSIDKLLVIIRARYVAEGKLRLEETYCNQTQS